MHVLTYRIRMRRNRKDICGASYAIPLQEHLKLHSIINISNHLYSKSHMSFYIHLFIHAILLYK